MKKQLHLLLLCAILFGLHKPASAQLANPGEILFTGFNADGTDGFAFVTLVDIYPNDTIWFTDEEWNGTTFATTNVEGDIGWAYADTLKAGSVVYVEAMATTTPAVSKGNVFFDVNVGPNLGTANEGFYAYKGSPRNPTVWLAAITNGTWGAAATGGVLPSALSQCSTCYQTITPISADVAAYNYLRTGQTTFMGYVGLIQNMVNWVSQGANGNQDQDGITPDIPFDTTSFILGGPAGFPPIAVTMTIESPTLVKIGYDRAVGISGENTANYNTTFSVSTATRNVSLDTVSLNLSAPLTVGLQTVIISNVADTNSINPTPMTQPDTLSVYFNNSTPNVIITEIMYNDPSPATDSLEFIELFNAGSTPADISGFSFFGVTFTAPNNTIIPAGGYIVVANFLSVFNPTFNANATLEISAGTILNTGETIALFNTVGDTIDIVTYSPNSPWPTAANGTGYSLVLCDPATDNSIATNWYITNNLAANYLNTNIYASPGMANMCATPPPVYDYQIATISSINANGIADSIGVVCKLTGVVMGVDLDGNAGYNFYISDDSDGINVFNQFDVDAYTVQEGDEVTIRGTIQQANGLLQIVPDSITLLSQSNAIPTPTIVTTLDETTESELIIFINMSLAVGANWPNPGQSATVQITDGTNTVNMRIDADTDIDNLIAEPTSTFCVTGVGSQFDNTNPFTGGYLFYPMFSTDFDFTCVNLPYAPELRINEIMSKNVSSAADEQGEFDDWIEIHNPTNAPVDLATLYISNLEFIPDYYQFPSGDPATIIPANGFALVWADEMLTQPGAIHLPFTLADYGGFVSLYGDDGTTRIDTVSYAITAANTSWARENDGTIWVNHSSSTPWASNSTTGIASFEAKNTAFYAFPNPSSTGIIRFNKPVTGNVYSVLGQQVASLKNTRNFVTTDMLPGVYFVVNDKNETIKIVIE